MKIADIPTRYNNTYVIILLVKNKRQPPLVLPVGYGLTLSMFEPLSQGSERPGLPLLAVVCRCIYLVIMWFYSKQKMFNCLFPCCMAGQNLNHNTM